MKRILFSLLALVMTAMTASAVAPAYKITVGTNDQGTFAFKVNNVDATPDGNGAIAVDEGDNITLTVTPNTGWTVNATDGIWYAKDAMARGQRRDVPMERVITLTPGAGNQNSVIKTYTFTMIRANAEISCSYKKDFSNTEITIDDIADVTYSGQAQTPAITVKDNGTELTEGTDYTVAYSNNINAGKADAGSSAPTVTITAVETSQLYSGTKTKTFTIKPKPITPTIEVSDMQYNAQPLSPSVTVKDGATTLTLGKDYTQVYREVINLMADIDEIVLPGTYRVILSAVDGGNYVFTPSEHPYRDFEVTKLTVTVKANDIKVVYNADPAYTATYSGFVQGDGTDKLSGKLNFSCDYRKGDKPGGKYTITPFGLSSNIYNIAYETGTLTVEKGYRNMNYEVKEIQKTFGDEKFINNTLNITEGARYHSSSATVASVDEKTGEVTIRGAGTATISAIIDGTEYYYSDHADYTLTVIERTMSGPGVVITQDQNGYSVTLTEDDDNPNVGPLNISGTVTDLDIKREFKGPQAGQGKVTIDDQEANLYTLCLPFALDPTQLDGMKFYTFSGVKGTTLQFTEEAKPAAYTPLVVAVFAGKDIILERDNVKYKTSHEINSTTVDGFTFTGTLTGLDNDAAAAAGGTGNVTYILQDNSKWGKVVAGNANVYISAFRAFVTGPDITPNTARTLDSAFDGSATAISSLRLVDADGTERWYDLNGRRIYKPSQKGVYIHNGKKVMIK